MLVDASQAVVAKYLYDPFGSTLAKSGILADANTYRFSSKEWNANSGLYYYLYRLYDPNVQRWLNKDPIGGNGFEILRHQSSKLLKLFGMLKKTDDKNLYEFVKNHPIGGFDALGLAPNVPTGPGSLACISAEEQAQAANDLAEAEPTEENIENAILASLYAALVCSPPKPPPDPTPPSCPSGPPWNPPPGPSHKCEMILFEGALIMVCILLAPVGA